MKKRSVDTEGQLEYSFRQKENGNEQICDFKMFKQTQFFFVKRCLNDNKE
jgi:hypothetical protein